MNNRYKEDEEEYEDYESENDEYSHYIGQGLPSRDEKVHNPHKGRTTGYGNSSDEFNSLRDMITSYNTKQQKKLPVSNEVGEQKP